MPGEGAGTCLWRHTCSFLTLALSQAFHRQLYFSGNSRGSIFVVVVLGLLFVGLNSTWTDHLVSDAGFRRLIPSPDLGKAFNKVTRASSADSQNSEFPEGLETDNEYESFCNKKTTSHLFATVSLHAYKSCGNICFEWIKAEKCFFLEQVLRTRTTAVHAHFASSSLSPPTSVTD